MYGRQGMCLQGFCCDTYGNETVGRTRFLWQDNIKNGSSKLIWGGMDCVILAKYTDRWRALMNAVMNFVVP